MILTQIDISHIRNLAETTLLPASGFNFIYGPNGAGKTSLLEAIHCLSVGHSFRSRKARELIAHDADHFSLACRMLDTHNKREHRSGLRRTSTGDIQLRLDYEEIRSIVPVTQLLPIKALTPDSHRLLQDGPQGRRQFVDWGSFHMDLSFIDAWKQYRRALSQRNQALRMTAPDAEVLSWDRLLSDAGSILNEMRAQYVTQLAITVNNTLEKLDASFQIDITYRTGWLDGLSLSDALVKQYTNCRRLRTTTVGPHRAELIVNSGGILARQVLSRGEQKQLVYALHLAQVSILKMTTGRQTVMLCDDLPSELDSHSLSKVLNQLEALDSQIFVTGTEPGPLIFPSMAEFHVNRGKVKKIV